MTVKAEDEWKLVLSRKGFDSSTGGGPSPILPDGRIVSLPIPDPVSPTSYSDIRIQMTDEGSETLGSVVEQVTRGRVSAEDPAHLDPDLDSRALARPNSWRPLFGQTGAAQGHIWNRDVGKGDIFLFYGWFRQADWVDGSLSFSADAPDLHVLFGWFRVGEIYHLGDNLESAPGWARYHPHFFGDRGQNNTLYVAAPRLSSSNRRSPLPGAGIFENVDSDLLLTVHGGSRTMWALPPWFYPQGDKPPLSYHGNMERWDLRSDHVLLDSASRGQEFVLDAERYPGSWTWLEALVRNHGMRA